MNRLKMVGLAIALATGLSFAQGSLWTPDAPFGIVYFDWIVECINGPAFNETDSEDPCYKDHGGWWFGFVAGPSSGDTMKACGPSSTKSTELNYLKAKIGGNIVSFVGPDYTNCEGPAVTNIDDGTSLLENSLELQFSIGNGEKIPADDLYEPDIAALAVNLSWADNKAGLSPNIPRDFSNKNGFCLTYESDHKEFSAKDEGLGIELGWIEDEASSKNKIPYDVWHTKIPVGSGIQVKDFPWTGGEGGTGVFRQEGWSSAPWPLSKAIGEMRSVKIRLKGYEETKVNFKLYQFGWAGECTTPGSTPIASGAKVASAVNFNMVNNIVNMTVSKPAAVQVINLHGKVVYSQNLTVANTVQKMNLNNLPTGVYMIRVPSLGYTNKIIVK
ncbi:MAG: T9SS type A sorting domain-containing protein [Fibromonadales bacterium]|nr:T9SS type A sorting domain-containing protein [Fibromonadales bacterium]